LRGIVYFLPRGVVFKTHFLHIDYSGEVLLKYLGRGGFADVRSTEHCYAISEVK